MLAEVRIEYQVPGRNDQQRRQRAAVPGGREEAGRARRRLRDTHDFSFLVDDENCHPGWQDEVSIVHEKTDFYDSRVHLVCGEAARKRTKTHCA